jgi:hypothetical protein
MGGSSRRIRLRQSVRRLRVSLFSELNAIIRRASFRKSSRSFSDHDLLVVGSTPITYGDRPLVIEKHPRGELCRPGKIAHVSRW